MDLSHRRNGGIFMPGRLKLSIYMNYGLLTVHVMRGHKLTRQDGPSTCIMIALVPTDRDTTPTRCRTDIIRGTSSPVYDEKFSFELSDDDMNKRLLISAVARDSASHHQESLGCMSFGLRSIRGGREVNGWYYLLSDDVGLHKHRHVNVKERSSVPPPAPVIKPVPAINQDVSGMEMKEIAVHRPISGEYGFTLVDSCPVRVGRVDAGSGAEEAGLLQGDVIVRVNGFNVSRSTSVSVARMVKRSGNMVLLEIHRANQSTPAAAMETTFNPSTRGGYSESDFGATSVQEFTICDERAALLESAISVDTRRQAALHRLLCLEENYVDLMNVGIQRFSRPLRHCLLTAAEHQQLFQNIEKITCMSEFQVRQIVLNLPSNAGSDDEDDSIVSQSQDLTWMVGMIYMTKLPVLCQAYTSYARGLPRAAQLLSDLENDLDFHSFLYNVPQKGRELGLCDFINRPLTHARELCDLMEMIRDTTSPNTRAHNTYKQVVKGLKSCVTTLQNASQVTSRIISPSASVFSVTTQMADASINASLRRHVPLMGSLVLKRAHSVQSSTSGFGSGSSQSSGEHGCRRETVV